MKGKILLLFCVLGFFSCLDRSYDGSERYVVQGVFVKNGEPLQHELVLIDAYAINEDTSVNQRLSAIDINSPSPPHSVVNATYTDTQGAFTISFPGGNYTYVLKLENYSKFLVNGKYGDPIFLIDLGTIDIAKKE